jgi:hypothetical protein
MWETTIHTHDGVMEVIEDYIWKNENESEKRMDTLHNRKGWLIKN